RTRIQLFLEPDDPGNHEAVFRADCILDPVDSIIPRGELIEQRLGTVTLRPRASVRTDNQTTRVGNHAVEQPLNVVSASVGRHVHQFGTYVIKLMMRVPIKRISNGDAVRPLRKTLSRQP